MKFRPIRQRNESFQSRGVVVMHKDSDDTINYTADFADLEEVQDGLTISSAAWEDSNVTVTNLAVSSPTVTCDIQGAGTAVLVLTLSDSTTRRFPHDFRVVPYKKARTQHYQS